MPKKARKKISKLKYPHIAPEHQEAHASNLKNFGEAVAKKLEKNLSDVAYIMRYGEAPPLCPTVSLSFISAEAKERCFKNKKFVALMSEMIKIAHQTK